VNNAPTSVPCFELASAAAINSTTKIQAMATICISDSGTQYRLLKIGVNVG